MRVQLHRLGVGQAPGAPGDSQNALSSARSSSAYTSHPATWRAAPRERWHSAASAAACAVPRRRAVRAAAAEPPPAAAPGEGSYARKTFARRRRRRRRRRPRHAPPPPPPRALPGGARLVRLRKERELAAGSDARRVEPRNAGACGQRGGVGAGSVRAGVLGRPGRRRRRRAARRARRRRRLPGVGARRRRRRRPALQVRRARARLAVGARGRRTRWRRARGHVGVIVDALRAGRSAPARAQRLGQRAGSGPAGMPGRGRAAPGAVLLPMLPARRGAGAAARPSRARRARWPSVR